MAKYKFSPHERSAVFTVHGEICYICRKPLIYAQFEVDHVMPEDLANDPERLAKELETLGRPANFDLNSYENWLPACADCNALKRNRVWEPSLLVQLHLQIAAEKAPRAREMEERQVASRELSKAAGTFERAAARGHLSDDQAQHLAGLLEFQQSYRDAHLRDEAVILTPTDSMEIEGPRVRRVSTGSALRRRVALDLYGPTCAVTGPGDTSVLQVASIIPYHERGLKAELDIRELLVLRSDVHTLFDKGLIAIDPDSLTVLVSSELGDPQYTQFHGRPAFLPSERQHGPDPELLAAHARAARTPFLGGEASPA